MWERPATNRVEEDAGAANTHWWNLGQPGGDLLGEGVEAVGLLGLREGHPHARGQRRVQNHGRALVARRQVHGGDGPDALSVQDDALGADAVPAARDPEER